MARGRGKKLSKKLVREEKYSVHDIDYVALEDELSSSDQVSVRESYFVTGYEEKPIKELHDMTEEELAEYLEWQNETLKRKSEEPHSKLQHIA